MDYATQCTMEALRLRDENNVDYQKITKIVNRIKGLTDDDSYELRERLVTQANELVDTARERAARAMTLAVIVKMIKGK